MRSLRKTGYKSLTVLLIALLLTLTMQPYSDSNAAFENIALDSSGISTKLEPLQAITNIDLLNTLKTSFGDPIEIRTGEFNFYKAGDFNKDGFGDIAVIKPTYETEKYTLDIMNGNGDGTFSTSQLTVSGNIAAALLGDFNGDGADDLLIMLKNEYEGSYTYTYSLMYGDINKQYSLSGEAFLYTGSQISVTIAVDDFNGDLKDDFLFVEPVCFPEGETEYGSLGEALNALGESLANLYNPFGGDIYINGLGIGVDSYYDSFTSPVYQSYNFKVYPGTSDIGLGYANNYSIPGNDIYYLLGLKTGDLNNDGKADLLISECKEGSGNLKTIFLNADGSYNKTENYAFNRISYCQYDFIKDGKSDLLAPISSNAFELHKGLGNGMFQKISGSSLNYNVYCTSVTSGDFNGDGKYDIALSASDNSILVQYGNGMGSFGTPAKYCIEPMPDVLIPYDFNKDGASDLIFNEMGNYESIYVMLSRKTVPSFEQNTQQTLLEAAAHESYIALTWRTTSYSSSSMSYNVYRSTEPGAGYTRLNDFPAGSSFVDYTAVNGITYYYIVKARLQNNSEGPASNEVSAVSALDVTLKLNEQNTLSISSGSDQFTINGSRRKLENRGSNTPFYSNGRFFTPIKNIVEAMGGVYEWNSAEQQVTITICDKVIEFWVGRYVMLVDGEEVEMNVAPILNDIRPLTALEMNNSRINEDPSITIPLSYLTRAFDWEATWTPIADGYNTTYSVTIKFNLPQGFYNPGVKVE